MAETLMAQGYPCRKGCAIPMRSMRNDPIYSAYVAYESQEQCEAER